VFDHIEAGLRSFDRSMPEEVNRVVADHVTDFAFAPTEEAATNLADEGIIEGAYVTGNTVVDACHEHRPIAENESNVLSLSTWISVKLSLISKLRTTGAPSLG